MRLKIITFVLILVYVLVSCGKSRDIHKDTPSEYRAKCFVVKIPYKNSSMEENMYLLYDENSKYAVIIDPGAVSMPMEDFILAKSLKVRAILNTHGHYDHIGANGYYKEKYSCQVYGNRGDMDFYEDDEPYNMPTKFISGDSKLEFGNIKIRVICTPGHSMGGTCFLAGDFLFSGDTLFKKSIGRTWEYDGKTAEEMKDMLVTNITDKILRLPETTVVFPGHGDATSIDEEKYHNPFL
jgi:glyoxylase-like metal-dependent hydrolase (beta-lactamase superfamily II)